MANYLTSEGRLAKEKRERAEGLRLDQSHADDMFNMVVAEANAEAENDEEGEGDGRERRRRCMRRWRNHTRP